MHKFFVPLENFTSNEAIIQGDDVKHIYKVLRLVEGDNVSINNGQGEEFLGVLKSITKKEVIVSISNKIELNNESPVKVHLYQGLPKSAKMDLISQKATELGISTITPIITERVIVKSELKEFNKIDRWNRIALEACKQSKRSLIPKINVPIEFHELLREIAGCDLIIVPYENAEGYGLKKVFNNIDKNKVKNVAIIIGPEGGFGEGEIEELSGKGAHIVTLGPRILRTETAGFTCLSLIMYEIGDLGGNI
ncbi:MAG: 16S rRNA (uracil(1498)-N(3))-methyltransferase [Clostridium sp.]